jgi:hypothetical protein
VGNGRTGIRSSLTSTWVSNADTTCATLTVILCACVN